MMDNINHPELVQSCSIDIEMVEGHGLEIRAIAPEVNQVVRELINTLYGFNASLNLDREGRGNSNLKVGRVE